MRILTLAVVASVLVTALPAQAAVLGFVSPVQAGDPDAGVRLETLLMYPSYVDANGNGLLDYKEPDETMYLDLDASNTVTFNDMRFTNFFTYGAGSAVDYTNRDFGRTLNRANGWFARTTGGDWYFDTNADRKVSVSDVILTGPDAGQKVSATNGAVGMALTSVQDQASQALRVGWSDSNGNQARDVSEAVYIDLNFDRQASVGDLRVKATGLGLDNEPTRAEFESTVATLKAADEKLAADIASETAARQNGDAALRNTDEGLAAQLDKVTNDLGTWTTWLLVLGLVALVAAVGAAWYARKLFRTSTEPHTARAPDSREHPR
jgi:hypothetical protein